MSGIVRRGGGGEERESEGGKKEGGRRGGKRHSRTKGAVSVCVPCHLTVVRKRSLCMCMCAQSLQLRPTLCSSMGCSPPGPSAHGILHAEHWSCCHALLQGIFPTQGSNLRLLPLLHCRQILYPLTHLGSPSLNICSNKKKNAVKLNTFSKSLVDTGSKPL